MASARPPAARSSGDDTAHRAPDHRLRAVAGGVRSRRTAPCRQRRAGASGHPAGRPTTATSSSSSTSTTNHLPSRSSTPCARISADPLRSPGARGLAPYRRPPTSRAGDGRGTRRRQSSVNPPLPAGEQPAATTRLRRDPRTASSRRRSRAGCRRGRGSRTTAHPTVAPRSSRADARRRRRRPLVHRIELVGREVEVLGRRVEGAERFDSPVDDRDDHVTAVEVQATRDRLIGVDPEDASRRTGANARSEMPESRYERLASLRPLGCRPPDRRRHQDAPPDRVHQRSVVSGDCVGPEHHDSLRHGGLSGTGAVFGEVLAGSPATGTVRGTRRGRSRRRSGSSSGGSWRICHRSRARTRSR